MKKFLIGLLIVLVIIQFFRPKKNMSTTASPNHISAKYNVPADVQSILNKACNDCHSNNTKYPWYNNIQPVAWWLSYHVKEGKAELNFDEFMTYPAKKADHKMEEVIEMVKKGEMPLNSYTWTHTDARITQAEKEKIVNWADGVRRQIVVP